MPDEFAFLHSAGTAPVPQGTALAVASVPTKDSDPATKNSSTPVKVQTSLSSVEFSFVTPRLEQLSALCAPYHNVNVQFKRDRTAI